MRPTYLYNKNPIPVRRHIYIETPHWFSPRWGLIPSSLPSLHKHHYNHHGADHDYYHKYFVKPSCNSHTGMIYNGAHFIVTFIMAVLNLLIGFWGSIISHRPVNPFLINEILCVVLFLGWIHCKINISISHQIKDNILYNWYRFSKESISMMRTAEIKYHNRKAMSWNE